jgi:hypothetical protein
MILDGISLSFYSDGICSEQFLVDQQMYFYGCAVRVEDTYYSTSPYSVDLVCSPGKTALPPLPHYDGRYIVHR